MKRRLWLLTVALELCVSGLAMRIETDRTWYLAGESMKVSIATDDGLIAYIELCDTKGLAAGSMARLADGKATTAVELPSDLHSGYYMLSAYTRNNSRVAQRLIAVINVLRRSADDDIRWINVGQRDSVSYARMESRDTIIPTAETPEVEGHFVKALIRNNSNGQVFSKSQIRPALSIVGKRIQYFEGAMVSDSVAVFLTHDLHGRLPMVLSATTSTGVALPIELLSPFATLLPKTLPHLLFHYQRSEVEARSLAMQRHQAEVAATTKSQQPMDFQSDYSPVLFGTQPYITYNLDEYRQFLTVREVLMEYVTSVTRKTVNGSTQLSVLKELSQNDSEQPSLVLIDSTPVNDTRQLLNYDARRIHYINVYNGQYTFGNSVYNGIISFVTRSGQLTNYPTESGCQYVVYEFP